MNIELVRLVERQVVERAVAEAVGDEKSTLNKPTKIVVKNYKDEVVDVRPAWTLPWSGGGAPLDLLYRRNDGTINLYPIDLNDYNALLQDMATGVTTTIRKFNHRDRVNSENSIEEKLSKCLYTVTAKTNTRMVAGNAERIAQSVGLGFWQNVAGAEDPESAVKSLLRNAPRSYGVSRVGLESQVDQTVARYLRRTGRRGIPSVFDPEILGLVGTIGFRLYKQPVDRSLPPTDRYSNLYLADYDMYNDIVRNRDVVQGLIDTGQRNVLFVYYWIYRIISSDPDYERGPYHYTRKTIEGGIVQKKEAAAYIKLTKRVLGLDDAATGQAAAKWRVFLQMPLAMLRTVCEHLLGRWELKVAQYLWYGSRPISPAGTQHYATVERVHTPVQKLLGLLVRANAVRSGVVRYLDRLALPTVLLRDVDIPEHLLQDLQTYQELLVTALVKELPAGPLNRGVVRHTKSLDLLEEGMHAYGQLRAIASTSTHRDAYGKGVKTLWRSPLPTDKKQPLRKLVAGLKDQVEGLEHEIRMLEDEETRLKREAEEERKATPWSRVFAEDNVEITIKKKTYRVRELVTENDLVAEGAAMRHCIGGRGYATAARDHTTYVPRYFSIRDVHDKRISTLQLEVSRGHPYYRWEVEAHQGHSNKRVDPDVADVAEILAELLSKLNHDVVKHEPVEFSPDMLATASARFRELTGVQAMFGQAA